MDDTESSFDAVLFDLDDTLLDGENAWQSGLKRLLARCPEVSPVRARSAWDAAFEQHFPRYLSGELTFDAHRAARMRSWADLVDVALPLDAELDWFGDYLVGYEAGWIAYPDVTPCLDTLAGSGLRLGIITNGDSAQQRDKLEVLGLTDMFAVVVAAGDIGIAKPDPRIFHHAAGALGLAPRRCAFVGDLRETDAIGAAGAGMKGIWLNRGERSAVASPDTDDGIAEIASLAELPSLL
ncbi:MAG TPA: HAD family hydrolase [Trebonia sp.]|nr:HAD family hydrolase [Trebonia sp.]